MKNKKCILASFIMIFTLMITLRVYAADIPSSKRIAGDNRYSTAVEISKDGWQTSNNVIIATGEDFPDALCAAPLAKQLDAPILLTGKNTLNANTSLELTRLIANKVYIIGGPGVVSDTVKKQIESKGIICERIFGNNRYATSIEVAKHLNLASEIVVATGNNFPDALSIAPIAAKNGFPIILTNKANLPDDVLTYINSKNITKSYIIGGTGVITDAVKEQLPSPDRIYGSNRYETNIAILNRFNSELNFATSYLATGSDFPDALAGSALAPKSMSPIILTGKTPSTVTKNYVLGKLPLITSLNTLGGMGVIPDTTISILLGDIKEPALLRVNYIDVGQADSILLQQGSNSMLIDAGNNADSELVEKYISDKGITKLDYVIGTHPHEDHIGGLDYIINSFQIGQIYMPKATSTTKTFEDVVTAIKSKGMKATVPTPGESFKLGEATCTILAPNGSGYSDVNNESIVIKVTFGSNSFLFTGDAEDVSENEMLSKGYNLKADVLKIGHHGSTSSTTQSFLNAVNPKYAVISVGEGNTYGHPAKETMDRLNSQKISVYRTDESGDIIAISDGTKITFNVNPSETPIEPNNADVKMTSIGLESEIVTIKNSGADDVDMTGWKLLSTVGMQTYDLPNDFILKAGTTIYITSGANAKDDGKVYLKWSGSYIWNNDGDLGELYDSNNQLVSSK
jgi:beta-lactamase superfamily II metal-dependent hydrolase/putative cell wall-binding protein